MRRIYLIIDSSFVDTSDASVEILEFRVQLFAVTSKQGLWPFGLSNLSKHGKQENGSFSSYHKSGKSHHLESSVKPPGGLFKFGHSIEGRKGASSQNQMTAIYMIAF